MNNASTAEKVNVVSNLITNMADDPAERLGIAAALFEMYRHNLTALLVKMEAPTTPHSEDGENKNESAEP